jgi:very-short-patch-repair endonuclease
MPRHRISRTIRHNARQLRREMSDAERLLWRHFRAHRFQDASFRRQVPIGPYIADFVCHSQKLVIELDGGQHAEPEALLADATRTQWLERRGYRVLRFWNTDVLTGTDAVLHMIARALAETRLR